MRVSFRRNVGVPPEPGASSVAHTRIRARKQTVRRPACGGHRRGNGPGLPQGSSSEGGIIHATFTWQPPTVRAGGTIDLRFDAWTRVLPSELTPNYRADNNPNARGQGGAVGSSWFEAAVASWRKSEYSLLFVSRATPHIRGPRVPLLESSLVDD